MCGISAIFGIEQQPQSFHSIVSMTRIISHRGPDDEGYVFFSDSPKKQLIYGGEDTPQVVFEAHFAYTPKLNFPQGLSLIKEPIVGALGHRRLSIIDQAPTGHQPMCSHDARFWISYNGEIYNYIEIRKELELLGHHFQTHCDTEVVLQAYQRWGKRCLTRFNGMFAFVIFDSFEKKIFAARDRFGEKPLYYWRSPLGFLAFGSEIKQFTVLPGWKAVVHGQSLYDFLNWGVTDHLQETLFDGVKQIRGGESLEINLLNIHEEELISQKWYQLQETPFFGSFEEASEQYLHLLRDAINLRLRGDLSLGSCLSGGLDSSSIVCLVDLIMNQKSTGKKLKTFSACSDNQKIDERFFVDIVTSKTSTKPHYIYPKLENLFDCSSNLIWHQDEPYCSTSIYAQWLIFSLAKEEKVKVMLDGQGADEQLAGYHSFFGARFYSLFCDFKWVALLREINEAKRVHSTIQPLHILVNKCIPQIVRQPVRRMMGKPATQPTWIDFKKLKVEDQDPFHHYKNKTILEQSCLQILKSNLPMLLRFADRNSMAHSTESRTPFLDYRLVEFSLGLPDHYKISNGSTKRILRESMREVLPEKIRSRVDKIGFATAEEEWLKGNNSHLFRNAVDDSLKMMQGVLTKEVTKMTEQMISGKRPFNHWIWRVISLGHWVKRFNVEIY